MGHWGIIDLILGLFFIYFILSVICTSLVEAYAQLLNLRAKRLKQWIQDVFNTPDGGTLGDEIINHGLVDGLTMNGKIASFIPPAIFSAALLDSVHQSYQKAKGVTDTTTPFDSTSLQEALKCAENKLPNDLKRYMLQAMQECSNAEESIAQLKKRIEHWYDDAMDRLSGSYKKKTRNITFVFAVIITLSTNANTITIARYLHNNPQTSERLAKAAEGVAKDSVLYKQTIKSIDAANANLNKSADTSAIGKNSARTLAQALNMIKDKKQQNDSLIAAIEGHGLPIGWQTTTADHSKAGRSSSTTGIRHYIYATLTMLAGWLATIFAVTLGAPFWFDMINKVVNIRSVGNSPASSKRG